MGKLEDALYACVTLFMVVSTLCACAYVVVATWRYVF